MTPTEPARTSTRVPDPPDGFDDAAVELAHGDAVALLSCQTRVLGLMSAGAELFSTLDVITRTLERLLPGSHCSMLLIDADGNLRHGSAPSLDDDYLAAIDGLTPGPEAGSCGTAAYLGRPVVVPDIRADARWTAYREAADSAGLRACWSTPVPGTSDQIVGTFAVYHGEAHRPTAREQRLVERLTYLASVAIGHASMIRAVTISEERFRRAFEDNVVAMALLDPDGTINSANDSLRQLTGSCIRPGTTTLTDLLVDTDGALEAMVADVRAGRVRGRNLETRVPDTDRVVSLTMSLVRGASEDPIQVSVNMLDVTERFAAQSERQARQAAEMARRSAEDASRAKSTFLSAVSHEMRTPLQAITGFAELLATLDLDAERRAEALRHIADGAQHLLGLVDDTLDLSRIEANALPLTIRPIDVAALIGDVVQLLVPLATERGVDLGTERCAGVVPADERRLRQVLINLVSNGVRYCGPDGRVRVGAAQQGDRVLITVTDDGPGVPPELRERLFEPFVHGSGESDDGIGLGLMLARGLTEAMDGRLSIADATGGGTVATVELRSA